MTTVRLLVPAFAIVLIGCGSSSTGAIDPTA
ncbi:MAG: hypothetical protein JWM53_5679, partial [bacterium]|nr:hypothetical protein [bacterium]